MPQKIEFQDVAPGNVHSRGHVVRFALPDGMPDVPSAQLRDLLHTLRSVVSRFALPDTPAEQAILAMESMPAGRAAALLATALQRHAGCDVVGNGWAGKADRSGGNWWVECMRFDIGRRAVAAARRHLLAAQEPGGVVPERLEATVDRLLAEIYESGTANQWHLVRIGRALRLPLRPLAGSKKVAQLGVGARSEHFFVSVPERESYVNNLLQHNKTATAQVLAAAGISVPVHHTVSNQEDACAAAAEVGFPVVIKPLAGEKQRGVEIDLRNEAELCAAIARQDLAGSNFLVERFFEGMSYRLMSAKGKLVSAYEVPPTTVIGDGAASVRELIERINQGPGRGVGYRFNSAPVDIAALEQAVKSPLRDRGLSLDSVLSEGEAVPISYLGGRSNGNTISLVTPKVHPDYEELLERIHAFVPIPICGIDIIAKDISAPAAPGSYIVNEINSRPALSVFNITVPGEPELFDMFKMAMGDSDNFRVPVVLVVTDADDGAMSLAVAEALGARCKTALANCKGYRIGQRWLSSDPHNTLPGSERAIADRQAEAVVLERAPFELAAAGLGLNQIDAVVFAPKLTGIDPKFFLYSIFAEHLSRRAAVYVDVLGAARGDHARKPGRLTVWTGAAGAMPSPSAAETDHFVAANLPDGKWRVKDLASGAQREWPHTQGKALPPADAVAAFIGSLFKPG